MSDAVVDDARPLRRPRREGAPLQRIAVVAGFALLYGWDLVEAIANLVALLAFAAAAGHPLNSYAWLVLGSAILVPPAAYVCALLIGWSRGPLLLAAVLGTGWAATAALGLTFEALLRA
ncbi:hypothetical protein [Naasia aerilata]|uniref:Uncharacterized protein n=1 Tax=Naasia aerilata TaxID=1162966 RepID=A0ABM8GCW3_9MICO|nr:hypothetical protein [Naasia aerilata]BDZ46104.1 hypothetical protein GCM10025866_20130 [Naasia aerilata]